jgi:hypothetical protein
MFTKLFKPADFLKALADGSLSNPLSIEGVAKPHPDDPQALQLSIAESCGPWQRVPLALIESVEFLGMRACGTHEHPYVRVHLEQPPKEDRLASFFAFLVGQSARHGPVLPPLGGRKMLAPKLTAFGFNVDVKLTDANDPTSFQFINITIANVPPGAQVLTGTWRGASVFVPSSGGDFLWQVTADGSTAVATAFDGPISLKRYVLILTPFIGPNGGLPQRGAQGTATVINPDDQSMLGDATWVIT